MKIYDIYELANRISPTWAVEDLLPSSGSALIYGQSGCGKSFFALALAMSLQSGRPFFGIPTQKMPCLYLTLEGAQGFTLRTLAYQQESGMPIHDLGFIIDNFSLGDSGEVAELLEFIPPRTVIFIDTLARASGGLDENSTRDMNTLISNVQLLANDKQCLTVLLHHTSKASPKAARGSSALLGAMDTAILIEAKKDGLRHWKVMKQKDGPDDAMQGAFRLNPVAIETHFDPRTGEQLQSAVAEPVAVDEVPTSYETSLGSEAAGVLSSLQRCMLEKEINKINLATWRNFYVECRVKQDNIKRTSAISAFSRAKSLLIEHDFVTFDGEFFQLNQEDVG